MARKVIAEFDAIDGPFINKLRAIDASVSRFETGTLSAFGRVEKGMNGLLASASRLQNVSGIIAGGFGAGMAAGFLDQATRIRRALKEAGDSSQEAFEKAFLGAQRSLSSFEAFSQGVARMAKATGDGFDASVRNMETLNKLLVLGGKTTQERMSTMIQFSQALQANVLQGEELRSLRENAPIELIRAIAREAGGTIEDLKEFGAQGRITAEVMIRALKSLEEEADIRMQSVTLTISEATTTLANAAIVASEAFDRGLGLSRATVAGLTGLAQILGESAAAAEMFGRALQVALAAGLGMYAGGKITAAIGAQRDFAEGLRTSAENARKEAVATRLAANAAQEAHGKKRSAMDEFLRKQDQVITAARTTAAEEAKAATAARHAAEVRKANSAAAVRMAQAELAAMDKRIAKETRLRSLGFSGEDRRELYGDAAYTRRIGGMNEQQFNEALRQREALQARLAKLDADRIASERAVTAAVGREAATRSRLDMAGMQAVVDYDKKTKRERARLAKELAAAEARVETAMQRQTVAAQAAAAANARLAFSTRAVAAAGTMLRSAWDFLGGWPGLILTAGLAFLALRGNVESAAERFDRLTSDTGEAARAADTLRDVQSRLNDAIREAGRESDASSARIIANTQAELKAKRDLLALETKRLETMQAERQAEINRLQAEVDGIYRSAEGEVRVQRQVNDDPAYLAQIMADADAKAAGLNDKIIELQANMALTGQAIAENNALLNETAAAAGATADQLRSTEPTMAQLEASAKEFAERLGIARDNAVEFAEVDMASGVAAAASQASALVSFLDAAISRAEAIRQNAQQWIDSQQPGGAADLANQYAQYGQGRQAFNDRAREKAPLYTPFRVPSDGGTGSGAGSGGGRAQENELEREALSLIESMMTAEERRAQKIAEAIQLREQLVVKYGAEHEMVQRVDEAIERMNQNLEESKSLSEQFFESMSDAIASSINDWKGWGNLVRSILASLVQKHGVDFFTALLMPGAQAGNSLGTWAGNMLTGQLHTGGGMHQRSARSVPAAAFMGAPRFHNGLLGLKPDEFTAILQKGETVLPKGMSLGGASVTVVNNNDFRGVDNVSRAFMEEQVAKMQRELPARVLHTVRNSQRKRELR